MPQKYRLKLPASSLKKQQENRLLWNKQRSLPSADFFTIGYSGRKFDEFLESLINAGVKTLIDIRQHAVSMYRPELSKGNLERRLKAEGINYLHAAELGVPRDIRAKALASGSREIIWQWYDAYVAKPYLRNLHRFLNSAEHPVALMCTEVDPSECHRHRLCVELEAKGFKSYEL